MSAAFIVLGTTAAGVWYSAPWSSWKAGATLRSAGGAAEAAAAASAAVSAAAAGWPAASVPGADHGHGRSLLATADAAAAAATPATNGGPTGGTGTLPAVSRAGSSYGTLCEPADRFLQRPAALALYIPGVLFTFVGLALVTDEYFVPSLERICDALQLTDDVAGATFSAAGSSAPELFTSLLAVFVTEDEVGVGTIVGSAVFNVLVIIGLSALLSGKTLQLDWRPLVRDSAFYTVFVIFLLVQVLWLTTGEAAWWEGLIMLSLYSLYIAFMAFGNTRYMRAMERFLDKTKQEELAEERRLKGCAAAADGDGNGAAVAAASGAATPAAAEDSVDAEAGGGVPPPPPSPPASPGVPDRVGGGGGPNVLSRRSTYGSTPRALSKASGELRPHFSNRSGGSVPRPASAASAGDAGGAGELRHALSSRTLRAQQRATAAAAKVTAAEAATAAAAAAAAVAGAVEAGGGPPAAGAAADGDSIGAGDSGGEERSDADAGGVARTFLGVARPTTKSGMVIFPLAFPWLLLFRYTIIDCTREEYARYWAVTFGVSVAWIAGISYLMVEAARFFGCIVGIPAAVLGVTVLAAGTSVPDALASVSVARAGKGDFAVSNALGSNCFDVGIGLGAPWFLGGLILGRPQIIPTEPITAIVVPVIILFGVLSSLLGLLFIRKWNMGPLVGWVLISGYVVFVAYSLIDVYVIQG